MQQARPYDIGVPDFDVLGTMASLQGLQTGRQKNALGEMSLDIERQKMLMSQQQRDQQAAYIASLPPDQRTLAGLDPSGYVGAMIDRLKPRAGVAVPEGGSVVNPYTGEVLLQGTPSVTWGDAPGAGGGATLQNARPGPAGAPGAPAAAGGPGTANGPPVPVTPYAAGVKAGENTTGNPAARNSRSTAVGDHQFLEGTWLEVLGKYRPDLVRGKSPAEVLKLREDGALSAQMADRYAQDNSAVLAQGGFEATPVNLALAHRFGPAGALRVLQAEKQNPNAPISSVMPDEVLQANPELRTMTIAQGRQRMEQQMGGAAGPGGAATSATPAPAPGSYDIRYDKGKPTEYPGKPGYVVARDRASGRIVAVPAPADGTTEADQAKRRDEELKRDEVRTKQSDTVFNNENTLRDEFNTLTKDYRVVADSYRKIHGAAKANNGAGDMSMLYSYVKLLDPNSVVRESEFALAAQSGSFGERIQGAVGKILSGERLPDTLRQSFLTEAENLFTSQQAGFNNLTKRYRTIAERRGLNADNVTGDYGEGAEAAGASSRSGKGGGNFRPPPVTGAPGQGVTVRVGDASAPALPPLPPGFAVVP